METERNEWKDIIGVSASIWTVLQMLSPLPTCYHFVKKQSVGDMIATPYIVAFTSCTLWLLYGISIGENTVVKVNLIGAGLQFSYTICYYVYCLKKVQVRQQLALSFFVIFASITYIIFEKDVKRLTSLFGFLCSCVTVLFFASPLANMRYVIKIWSSESLPRMLIAATFIVSVQWTLYGYIINDSYILVTNFLGAILSSLQIALMLIIPKEPNPKLVSNILLMCCTSIFSLMC